MIKMTLEEKRRHERCRQVTYGLAYFGFIRKSEKCEHCGGKERLEFHHLDYNNPFLFKTLCHSCHMKEEGKLRSKK